MGKARLLNKLRKFTFGTKTKVALGGAGVATGSALGYTRAEPGLRKSGTAEGAVVGGLLGAGMAFSPSLTRVAARSVVAEGKLAYRSAKVMGKRKGKLIFRRIRGKLRPMRVKE